MQHAPASLLHALCWEVSKWQVFKKPKDLCCIPWGMMQSVITEGTEPADFCSTAAVRIERSHVQGKWELSAVLLLFRRENN